MNFGDQREVGFNSEGISAKEVNLRRDAYRTKISGSRVSFKTQKGGKRCLLTKDGELS